MTDGLINVLDADGVPIKVGDTVWFSGPGKDKWTLSVVGTIGGLVKAKCGVWTVDEVPPGNLTHRCPDTQGKIDADAMLKAGEYMRENPRASEFHEMGAKRNNYSERQAMVLDLLRRQRELCANAWNTRAERTCMPIACVEGASNGAYKLYTMNCSECGEFLSGSCDEAVTLRALPDYCPNCGAKVVR